MGKYSDMIVNPPKKQWHKKLARGGAEKTGKTDMSNYPLNSVMTEAENPEKSASFVTNLMSGLADDPKTQVRVYAAARFPDLPEGERLKRYGIDDGNVVFLDDEGVLRRENADTLWQNVKKFTGKTAAHTPAIAMGTIGSMGGPILAALGAAGGEGIRKTIAGAALDEPQTTGGNLFSMGREAATAYVGDVVGRQIGKGFKILGKKPGGKVGKLTKTSTDPKKIARMEKLGEDFGIDLFTPQTSGNKRLSEIFNLLGDLDYSSDVIQAARQTQYEQIDSAIYNYIKSLSGATSSRTKIGQEVVDAAKDSVKKMVDARRAKASPLYKKAFSSGATVDIEPVVRSIDSGLETAKGQVRSALMKAKQTLLRPDLPKKAQKSRILDATGQPYQGPSPTYDTTLKGLHDAKMALDDYIEVAGRSGSNTVKREYSKIKEQLLGLMDNASPDYRAAREIFSSYSDAINLQTRKTLLGEVSALEGDKVVNATKRILSSAEVKRDPDLVLNLKSFVRRADPDLWDSVVADYLQTTFETIKDTATGGIPNIGGNFYKKVWGDPAQKKVLQRAMTKDQFKTLGEFMEVLKTSGMILGRQSATATRQQLMEDIAGNQMFNRTIRAATRPLVTKEKIMGDMLLDKMLSESSQDLALALTSKRGAKDLRRMVQFSGDTEKIFPMLMNFMTQVTNGEYQRSKVDEDVGFADDQQENSQKVKGWGDKLRLRPSP